MTNTTNPQTQHSFTNDLGENFVISFKVEDLENKTYLLDSEHVIDEMKHAFERISNSQTN